MGLSALNANTDGSSNTAFGTSALLCNTTGNFNIAIGPSALAKNTGGSSNTALGLSALSENLTGSGNVAVGQNTLQSATNVNNNTAIGISALNITSGSDNSAIGYVAGNTNTTGSNNTFIGANAQGLTATSSNTITLGDSSITTLRSNATLSGLSDCRDKTNIQPIPVGLNFVNALRPVKFDWARRDGSMAGKVDAGFIAQELKALIEEQGVKEWLNLVLDENPDRLEATPGKLIPVMVKAIQELAAEIAELKKKLP
jgi:hypothetical protein